MENVSTGMSGYFQSLERLLDCPKALRRSFLGQTRRMAEDFLQGKPDATVQEVSDYLGEPRELAQGFLETLEPEVLERYQKRKESVRWALIALTAAIVMTLGAWVYILKSQSANVEVTETIIIYRDIMEGT